MNEQQKKDRVLLSPAQVSERYGGHIDALLLAQWRSDGDGPNYYKLGRRCFYDEADLIAWEEANKKEIAKV